MRYVVISVFDSGFLFGDGVWEGCRFTMASCRSSTGFQPYSPAAVSLKNPLMELAKEYEPNYQAL